MDGWSRAASVCISRRIGRAGRGQPGVGKNLDLRRWSRSSRVSEVHDPHPAFAEESDDLIGTEAMGWKGLRGEEILHLAPPPARPRSSKLSPDESARSISRTCSATSGSVVEMRSSSSLCSGAERSAKR